MGHIIKNIDTVLASTFPGADIVLETVPGNGDRITGYIAWQNFEGTPYKERQWRLYDALTDGLPIEEMKHVSSILAFTPGERNAYREGVEDDD